MQLLPTEPTISNGRGPSRPPLAVILAALFVSWLLCLGGTLAAVAGMVGRIMNPLSVARPGETLILLAYTHDDEVLTQAQASASDRIQQPQMAGLRIERYRSRPITDTAGALALGRQYSASLVVWLDRGIYPAQIQAVAGAFGAPANALGSALGSVADELLPIPVCLIDHPAAQSRFLSELLIARALASRGAVGDGEWAMYQVEQLLRPERLADQSAECDAFTPAPAHALLGDLYAAQALRASAALDLRAARSAFVRADSVYEMAARAPAGETVARLKQASNLREQASVVFELSGRATEAVTLCQQSAFIVNKVMAAKRGLAMGAEPGRVLLAWADAQSALARAEAADGRNAESASAWQEALAAYRDALDAGVRTDAAQLGLAEATVRVAQTLSGDDKTEQILRTYDSALDALDGLLARPAAPPMALRLAGDLYAGLAEVEVWSGAISKAYDLADTAIQHYERAIDMAPPGLAAQLGMAYTRMLKAVVWETNRSKYATEAASDFRAALDQQPSTLDDLVELSERTPALLYLLAGYDHRLEADHLVDEVARVFESATLTQTDHPWYGEQAASIRLNYAEYLFGEDGVEDSDVESILRSARSDFEKVLAHAPDSFVAQYGKGRAQSGLATVAYNARQFGRAADLWRDAISAYDAALDFRSGHTGALYRKAYDLDSLAGALYHENGDAEAADAVLRDAIAAYDELLAITPTAEATYSKAYSQGTIASHLADAGRIPEAIWARRQHLATLDAALHLDPNYYYAHWGKADALVSLSYLLEELGRTGEALDVAQQAVRAAEKALDLAPPNDAIYLLSLKANAMEQRAGLLERQSRLIEALPIQLAVIEARQHAAEVEADDYDLWSMLAASQANYAMMLRRAGRQNEAIDYHRATAASYQRAFDIDEGTPDDLVSAGYAYHWLARYDEDAGNQKRAAENWRLARDHYSRALDAGYAEPDLRYNRGVANYALKNWSDAVDDFTAYLAGGEVDVQAYLLRGIAYARLGSVTAARADLRRVLEQSDDPNDIEQATQELRDLDD